MKNAVLMLLMFLILLISFFSSSGYTGQYLRATEGRLGDQAWHLSPDSSDSSAWRFFETRQENNFRSLSAVGPLYDYKTKASGQPTFTTSLPEGKGDINCDGHVDKHDFEYLNQAYRRGSRTLDTSFDKGLIRQFFSGKGDLRDKYVGKDVCDLKAGDFNGNGRIDYSDVKLFSLYLYNGGELEGNFVQENCAQEGSYMNVDGDICSCVRVGERVPYSKEVCTPVPAGFHASQVQHGEVKILSNTPPESY